MESCDQSSCLCAACLALRCQQRGTVRLSFTGQQAVLAHIVYVHVIPLSRIQVGVKSAVTIVGAVAGLLHHPKFYQLVCIFLRNLAFFMIGQGLLSFLCFLQEDSIFLIRTDYTVRQDLQQGNDLFHRLHDYSNRDLVAGFVGSSPNNSAILKITLRILFANFTFLFM